MKISQNILVVDDLLPNRLLIKELLSHLVVNIDEAEDGVVALEKVKENNYSVILLDIIMPRMDGIQLLKKIKEIPEKSNIPVILITANDVTNNDIIEGVNAGAFDYLQKPIISDVLVGKIELFLKLDDHHRKLEQLVEKLEKANYKIRINENRFRKISMHAAEGIILFNQSGVITYLNKAAENIFGFSQNEIKGELLDDLIEVELSDFLMLFQSHIENNRSTTLEKNGIAKYGHHISLEISLSGFKLGVELHGIIICRDITKRKRIERELLKAKEYREANKLMNDFLSKLDHELRTPLNAIIGISSILMKDSDSFKEKQRQGLNLIYDNGNQLFRIVENLLFFRDKQKLKITEIDINIYIEKLSSYFLKITTGKNLEFETHISERMPKTILSDKQLLDSVLFNLLDNAVKFTKQGIVKLSFDYTNDDIIFIKVSDTGIGIKEEEIETIFKRFQQLEDVDTRKYGGIGLGLSVVNDIVKNSFHGDINIESELNVGTTIKISIPNQND